MDPAAGRMRVIVMRAPASRDGVERPMNQNQTGPEPLVAVPGQLKCVLGGVLLSRTLAGAVPSALSGLASGFGMDAGRFPVAVTTETTTWAVRCGRRLVRLYSVVRVTAPSQPTLTRVCAWCVWLVVRVGCGPYSGRFAFTVSLTPAFPRTLGVWRVLGCCCLCWPISTSQLTDRCRSSTPGLSTQ